VFAYYYQLVNVINVINVINSFLFQSDQIKWVFRVKLTTKPFTPAPLQMYLMESPVQTGPVVVADRLVAGGG
jgi:hypothetical protein